MKIETKNLWAAQIRKKVGLYSDNQCGNISLISAAAGNEDVL